MCSLEPETAEGINWGLAAMPPRRRSIPIGGRAPGGNRSDHQRRYREAMARKTSPQGSGHGSAPRGEIQPMPLEDDTDWHHDHDHDEPAHRRARRLLSQSNSSYRIGDRFGAFGHWLTSERWVKRLAIVTLMLMVIFGGCFGALWWRLGAGPITLDMATPWLAAAIEENIGHDNTVEVGGTQIERAGRIRIAVRLCDVTVMVRAHVVVASAPKAEVRLSGTALLMGQLRAESLNLVDATLAVRITPDGYVTVSTGDNARPLATGVTSNRRPGASPSSPAGPLSAPAPQGAVSAPQAPGQAAIPAASDKG